MVGAQFDYPFGFRGDYGEYCDDSGLCAGFRRASAGVGVLEFSGRIVDL
jgi:hypothetical protein